MLNMVERVPMTDRRLPLREWDSPGVDPALVIVRLLRANTLLVADLHEVFADSGLPPVDIARLL